MLRETLNVRQIPGEGRRRWFTDTNFDLIVWYTDEGALVGFQLCYDKQGREKAFTWRKGHRSVQEAVDGGESPGHMKLSPVLSGTWEGAPAGLADDFFRASAGIDDRELVRLVYDAICRDSETANATPADVRIHQASVRG